MKRTLILHGLGGSDFPHWQSYLAAQLAQEYGTVSFPLFQGKDAPKYDVWMQQAHAVLQEFKPDCVVCHSLANTLWFHLCNEGKIKTVKNLFLVAPPSLTCKVETLSTFFPVALPCSLYATNVTLITSDNDPYMAAEEAESLAKSLHVKHIVLKGAGHINTASGYGKWPEIVTMVRES